jgi:hypothetical protein
MSDRPLENDHWLVRPTTIRALWAGAGVVLAAVVAADLAVGHHPHFGIEGTIGFSAWFGFGACVVLVLVAKVVGALLKRPDTYYDD